VTLSAVETGLARPPCLFPTALFEVSTLPPVCSCIEFVWAPALCARVVAVSAIDACPMELVFLCDEHDLYVGLCDTGSYSSCPTVVGTWSQFVGFYVGVRVCILWLSVPGKRA